MTLDVSVGIDVGRVIGLLEAYSGQLKVGFAFDHESTRDEVGLDKEREICEVLAAAERGQMSDRELADAVSWEHATVRDTLKQLRAKGAVASAAFGRTTSNILTSQWRSAFRS